MEKNFATRLDSIYSVFSSKDTALYDEATQELRTLVKESYETHINIIRHKEDGMWETVYKLPINNCAVHPRTDGGFDFIHEGNVTTYGANYRFAKKKKNKQCE